MTGYDARVRDIVLPNADVRQVVNRTRTSRCRPMKARQRYTSEGTAMFFGELAGGAGDAVSAIVPNRASKDERFVRAFALATK